jgi:hypothetical protein
MPIRMVTISIVLSATAWCSQAAGAAVNPRCEVMATGHEKIACTCALRNGGWVKHVHGIWRYNYPTFHMDSVHRCVRAAGA